MKQIKIHRNSQKRFYSKDKIYFITANTNQRFPFFKEDLFCELFIENLKLSKQLKNFKLFAFTIIWDHVHLLLKPIDKFDISQIMQLLKKSFSRDFNNLINFANNEGEIHESRLQGKQYSFYKNQTYIVPEYKKYIIQIEKFKNISPFKWQQSFHDHVIRNEKDFIKHLHYIIFNCVKHGVCEDEEEYRWSSINSEFSYFIDDWQ